MATNSDAMQAQTNEKQAFMSSFDKIVTELINDLDDYKLPQNGKEWIEKMVLQTVTGGKMNRGMTVPASLRSILKRKLTEKETSDSHVLGWCIELLQAMFLVADDIMDSSITRRGLPCWYRMVKLC